MVHCSGGGGEWIFSFLIMKWSFWDYMCRQYAFESKVRDDGHCDQLCHVWSIQHVLRTYITVIGQNVGRRNTNICGFAPLTRSLPLSKNTPLFTSNLFSIFLHSIQAPRDPIVCFHPISVAWPEPFHNTKSLEMCRFTLRYVNFAAR